MSAVISLADLLQAFFMIQQPLFAPDTATESDQLAVAADHAVAGNNQRNRVSVVGIAYSSKSPWAVDGAGHIAVGCGLTKGNFFQLPPDGSMKKRKSL
jgi:hypothetical protein